MIIYLLRKHRWIKLIHDPTKKARRTSVILLPSIILSSWHGQNVAVKNDVMFDMRFSRETALFQVRIILHLNARVCVCLYA